jgi:hypothetical protein
VSELKEPPSEAAALQELINQLDPESRTLFAEAALGRDAREFFDTDLGRYMVGCAQQEYAAAMAKLKTVAWWRRRRIVQLQNEAWRAEQFMVWLRDLIIKGTGAEMALEEQEEST